MSVDWFRLKYLENCRMDYLEIWCKHLRSRGWILITWLIKYKIYCILLSIAWIVTSECVPFRIDCNNFGDPLAVHLAPSSGHFSTCDINSCKAKDIPIKLSCTWILVLITKWMQMSAVFIAELHLMRAPSSAQLWSNKRYFLVKSRL